MNGLSIISLVVCLGLLTLRFFLARDTQRRTGRQRIKYVRILISAALALAAIGYALQRHSYSLDGSTYEPSIIERIVMAFSNK